MTVKSEHHCECCTDRRTYYDNGPEQKGEAAERQQRTEIEIPPILFDDQDDPISSKNWELIEKDRIAAYPKEYTLLSLDIENATPIMWRIFDPLVSLNLDEHPDSDVRALHGIEVFPSSSMIEVFPLHHNGTGDDYPVRVGAAEESYVVFFPDNDIDQYTWSPGIPNFQPGDLSVDERERLDELKDSLSDCSDSIDIVSLDDLVPTETVALYSWPFDPNIKATCLSRSTLRGILDGQEPMHDWVDATDDVGHGGHPGNLNFYRIPIGGGATWIDSDAAEILKKPDVSKVWFQPVQEKARIGSDLGMSSLHGQYDVIIYGVQKYDLTDRDLSLWVASWVLALKVPLVPISKGVDLLPEWLTYTYELGIGDGSRRTFPFPPVFAEEEELRDWSFELYVTGLQDYCNYFMVDLLEFKNRMEDSGFDEETVLNMIEILTKDDYPTEEDFTEWQNMVLTDLLGEWEVLVHGAVGELGRRWMGGWFTNRCRRGFVTFGGGPKNSEGQNVSKPPPVGARIYLKSELRTTKDKDWENHLKLGGWADSFDSFDDTDEFVPGKVVNIVQLFEKLRPKYRGLKWSAPWKNDMDNYPAGYLVVDAKKGDDNTITVRAIARQEDFFDKDTSY